MSQKYSGTMVFLLVWCDSVTLDFDLAVRDPAVGWGGGSGDDIKAQQMPELHF